MLVALNAELQPVHPPDDPAVSNKCWLHLSACGAASLLRSCMSGLLPLPRRHTAGLARRRDSVHAGAGMDWSPGDAWSLDMALPGGEYDFKFVVQRQDGSAGDWEPGANRTIKVTICSVLWLGEPLGGGSKPLNHVTTQRTKLTVTLAMSLVLALP